jgi:hypothetical protein
MKTIKYIIPAFSICMLYLLSSCSDTWLDPANPNQIITEDTTFTIPANAEKFVNACYTNLLQWQETTFSWIGVSSITSDDADKGSDPGDTGADKNLLDDLSYTSEGLSFGEVWAGNYNGVTACNQAIAQVPQFNIDESLKNRLIGEAKFLRALYYFNLVRCFGEVPLVDKVIDANNPSDIEKAFTRAPVSAIYSFMEQDLNDAINSLPIVDNYEPKDIGRATKGAAMGLLAKVSLYEKKWQPVLDLTDQIISGEAGDYSLVSDYSTIWREIGENSTESLFEIQGRGISPIASVQQYSEVQGPRGTNAIKYQDGTPAVGGWGFNTPTADLDNAYEPGDLRKKATIMHKGDTLFDGAILQNGAANDRYNNKAYVSKTMESYSGDASHTSKNVRILRMGEVYLLNAEAANELGNTSKAQSSLNAVRHRAGLGDTPASNQADLRNAIWKERRVELGMEHDRFFDLVRQGRAGEVLRAHGKNFVDGKNEIFPIPQKEIDASLGRYTQNPGY